jgi:hypothetical protein
MILLIIVVFICILVGSGYTSSGGDESKSEE